MIAARLAAAAGALALAALAGCGTAADHHAAPTPAMPSAPASGPDDAQGPATPPQPANPVALIRKAGFETSATLGDHDVYGDRMADSYYDNAADRRDGAGETMDCYTYATQADASEREAMQPGSDDSNVWIDGPLWSCQVSGVDDVTTGSTVFYVKPSVIAARLGGHIR